MSTKLKAKKAESKDTKKIAVKAKIATKETEKVQTPEVLLDGSNIVSFKSTFAQYDKMNFAQFRPEKDNFQGKRAQRIFRIMSYLHNVKKNQIAYKNRKNESHFYTANNYLTLYKLEAYLLGTSELQKVHSAGNVFCSAIYTVSKPATELKKNKKDEICTDYNGVFRLVCIRERKENDTTKKFSLESGVFYTTSEWEYIKDVNKAQLIQDFKDFRYEMKIA